LCSTPPPTAFESTSTLTFPRQYLLAGTMVLSAAARSPAESRRKQDDGGRKLLLQCGNINGRGIELRFYTAD
jgi:hypothetical protein